MKKKKNILKKIFNLKEICNFIITCGLFYHVFTLPNPNNKAISFIILTAYIIR